MNDHNDPVTIETYRKLKIGDIVTFGDETDRWAAISIFSAGGVRAAVWRRTDGHDAPYKWTWYGMGPIYVHGNTLQQGVSWIDLDKTRDEGIFALRMERRGMPRFTDTLQVDDWTLSLTDAIDDEGPSIVVEIVEMHGRRAAIWKILNGPWSGCLRLTTEEMVPSPLEKRNGVFDVEVNIDRLQEMRKLAHIVLYDLHKYYGG